MPADAGALPVTRPSASLRRQPSLLLLHSAQWHVWIWSSVLTTTRLWSTNGILIQGAHYHQAAVYQCHVWIWSRVFATTRLWSTNGMYGSDPGCSLPPGCGLPMPCMDLIQGAHYHQAVVYRLHVWIWCRVLTTTRLPYGQHRPSWIDGLIILRKYITNTVETLYDMFGAVHEMRSCYRRIMIE